MELIQVVNWVVLVNYFTILFPNGANGSFLNMKFHKTLAGGLYLKVHETHTDVGCIEQCAVLCTEGRELDHRCLAFRFDDLGNTCFLYTKGGSMLSHPGVEIFYIEAQDVFHIVRLRNRWYSIYVSEIGKNFTGARTRCNNLGGYLLEFDSPDEYEVVYKVANFNAHWVGANDLDSDTEWVTDREGLPINTTNWLWEPGQPNSPGVENCAMVHNNKIYDRGCHLQSAFLCEKDIP